MEVGNQCRQRLSSHIENKIYNTLLSSYRCYNSDTKKLLTHFSIFNTSITQSICAHITANTRSKTIRLWLILNLLSNKY